MELEALRDQIYDFSGKIVLGLNERSKYAQNNTLYTISRKSRQSHFMYELNKVIHNKPDLRIFIKNSYLPLISSICEPGETPEYHKKILQLDMELVKLFEDRVKLGDDIARSKISKNPKLLEMNNKALIRFNIRNPEQEIKVVDDFMNFVDDYMLEDKVGCRLLIRDLINTTVKSEVDFVLKRIDKIRLNEYLSN